MKLKQREERSDEEIPRDTFRPFGSDKDDFDELRDVNHDEMEQGILPKLKESGLDVSAYDTVFVSCPVWATEVPRQFYRF